MAQPRWKCSPRQRGLGGSGESKELHWIPDRKNIPHWDRRFPSFQHPESLQLKWPHGRGQRHKCGTRTAWGRATGEGKAGSGHSTGSTRSSQTLQIIGVTLKRVKVLWNWILGLKNWKGLDLALPRSWLHWIPPGMKHREERFLKHREFTHWAAPHQESGAWI